MMRFIANLLVLVSIFSLPWWAVCFLLAILLFIFDFPEAILFGLVLDILYGIPEGFFSAHGFIISTFFLYAISIALRPYLKEV